jgi:quinol monooxygenase YgiN
MVKLALFVKLRAKPGKESELQKLLEGALSIVDEEDGTPLWFALKFDKSTFGIFDAFDDETGRKAHLDGRVAAALMAKAPDLLAETPVIEKIDLLASKVEA